MKLPEFERVIYKNNPLTEVVCQLRFPPILKISHEEPADFQDKIRANYPLFETTKSQIPSEIATIVSQFGLPLQSDIAYTFKSEDQKWKLSITKDFIALTTSSYERYEQFKDRFKTILEIFEQLYKPSYYLRVGLRYQNLIIRSKLGIEEFGWPELISSRFASELHDPEIETSIQTIVKNLSLNIDDAKINLNHGLVSIKETQNHNEEIAYLFDTDFYTDHKIEGNENVWKTLDQFNRSIGKLFRWSITDVLHNAMQPQSVDSIPT